MITLVAMQTAAKMRSVSGRTRVRPSSALTMRNRKRPAIVEVSRGRLGTYSNKYRYLCKDSIVEVTSKISGYVGSWYEAKVLKPPQLPKSKFKCKRETLVEYTNLLNKNRTRLLRESVDVVLVRPLPPRIVADLAEEKGEEEEEEEEEMIFEVGDEVNTYDKDGWWAGVLDRVVRRRTEDGKEEESYVVRFEDPKHEIEFRGHELRLHLDWCDGKWFVSRGRKSQELLVTANGCVSLASIHNSFKETATIDRPVVLGFSTNNFPKMAAFEEPSSPIKRKTSRCLPMRFLHKTIDPEYPRGSSFPAKKIKRTCMEDPLVPVSGTSAESISELCDAEPLCLRPALRLTYNDVNPLRECENKEAGSSVTGAFNRKDNANNHAKWSNRRRKSSKPTRIILPTRTCVVEKADGVDNKSSIEEQLFVGTRLTHEEKRGEVQNIEDVSKYTSMEDQSIAAVGTDLTEKERGEVQNRESIHKNPSVEEASHMACRTELNSMERGHSHVVENCGMSLGMDGVSGEQCAGDDVVEVDQSLPFVKSSPIWEAVESLEVFQKFPQNPHFLPLIEEREGVREGLAIAKMVTFANTAENIIKLSIDNPTKRFTDCLETIRSLELHGFDTKAMENRLTKLIALKEEGQKMEEQKNEIANQNSELTHENAQLAKDICKIVDKIRSYQEQLGSALLSKKEKDSKISILKTSLDLMDMMMRDAQVSFEELNVSW